MTDRPIIFSAPMVRALLAGRKTQTRRLATSPLRRVEVGDRLYVRESIRVWPEPASDDCEITYLADDRRWQTGPCSHGMPDEALAPYFKMLDNARAAGKAAVRPSIHMPRWASRLTLIVEAVRVEPLQAISEDDAIAEGVERGEHPITGEIDGWQDYSIHHAGPHKGKRHPHAIVPWKSAALSFQSLWETLHGMEGWQDNPDVVALTFRVVRDNVDQIERLAA